MTAVPLSEPIVVLLDRARAARASGDFAACHAAAEAVLRQDGRNLLAVILKGDALKGLGDERAASSFYAGALKLASQAQPSADALPELQRIQKIQADNARAFEERLRSGLEARGYDPAQSSERFSWSLDVMNGRRRLYYQQPKFYLFPGLPQVEFQPRKDLPWLEDVEAAAPKIRAELDAILSQPELFTPYVEDRTNRPQSGQMGMVGNTDWSAVFLMKDGAEVPEIASRCPVTMEVLSKLPLSRVPGRSPSILFSRLKAGAKIPPHHGLINTRLICHLPLVAPPGSWFRVGSDVRQWEEGKAWAFDDTIEHEARNDSGQDRTILIFDVWKPELSAEEQQLVMALFEAIDAAGGSTPKLGT